MTESTFVEQWLVKRANLNNTSLDMKDQELKNGDSASNFLRKLFWTLIALANVLILGDILLNRGSGLINLFFLLTGSY